MSVHEEPLGALSMATREFWERSVSQNSVLTPFLSRTWLTCWAAAYGMTQDSTVLVWSNPEGDVRALLPLMRWRGELRSLSYNASDYTGLVWNGDPRAAVGELTTVLRERALRTRVRLWNVRPDDPLIQHLTATNAVALEAREIVSQTALHSLRLRPWHQLARISVRELERKHRKLQARGANLVVSSTVSDETLASMVDIHTRAWHRRGEAGSFGDGRRLAFVRDLIRLDLPLLFARLYIDDGLASYRFGPIDSNVYYDWNTGTDPEYAKFSPGVLLLARLLNRLAQTERVHTVDFVRGGEDYKRSWTTNTGWVSEYLVRPVGGGTDSGKWVTTN